MLLAFVLLGRSLEARARAAASADLTALARLIPDSARLVLDPGAAPRPKAAADGGGAAAAAPAAEEVMVRTATVRAGDVVRVLPGERVPVDGLVISGTASGEHVRRSAPGRRARAKGQRGVLSSRARCHHSRRRGTRACLPAGVWSSLAPAHLCLALPSDACWAPHLPPPPPRSGRVHADGRVAAGARERGKRGDGGHPGVRGAPHAARHLHRLRVHAGGHWQVGLASTAAHGPAWLPVLSAAGRRAAATCPGFCSFAPLRRSGLAGVWLVSAVYHRLWVCDISCSSAWLAA